MAIKYTEWADIFTERPKFTYTNIVRCKTLQNWPKLGFLVWKYTIWQPWWQHRESFGGKGGGGGHQMMDRSFGARFLDRLPDKWKARTPARKWQTDNTWSSSLKGCLHKIHKGPSTKKHYFCVAPSRMTPRNTVRIDPNFGCIVSYDTVRHKNNVFC
jgi:hypothetical protein